MNQQELPESQSSQHKQNFWVCSSPFISSTLLFDACPDGALINLFDADGANFNQLKINLETGKPGLLDLEPCMAECKFESGMKYARMQLESKTTLAAIMRLHTRDWCVMSGAAVLCSAVKKYLLPIENSSDKTTLLVVLNSSANEVELRVRLFLDKRSPESIMKVPAYGARIFDCRQDFAEVLDQYKDLQLGYLRVSVVGDEQVFVQSLEVPSSGKQPRYFSSLT